MKLETGNRETPLATCVTCPRGSSLTQSQNQSSIFKVLKFQIIVYCTWCSVLYFHLHPWRVCGIDCVFCLKENVPAHQICLYLAYGGCLWASSISLPEVRCSNELFVIRVYSRVSACWLASSHRSGVIFAEVTRCDI